MADWIKLDPAKLNQQRAQRIGGVQVNVMLSPHDVPTAARAERDAGNFVVEFQYLDDEPWESESQHNGVSLRVGKHSGRLYGIVVPAMLIHSETVSPLLHLPELIDKAIDDLSNNPPRVRRLESVRGNYRAAKQAVAGAIEQWIAPPTANQPIAIAPGSR